MIFSASKNITLQQAEEELLIKLANDSYEYYAALKNHPDF